MGGHQHRSQGREHRQLLIQAGLVLGQLLQVGQGPTQVGHRFVDRAACSRVFARRAPPGCGPGMVTGTREMVGQKLGPQPDQVGKACQQHLGDARMVTLARGAQQAVVGHVLHQRMLEGVDGGAAAVAVDQAGGQYLVQVLPELLLGHLRHGGQQLVQELAAQHGTQLEQRTRRAQAVDTGHQRGLHRGRNHGRRQASPQLPGVLTLDQRVRFDHRARHLLEEQGVAGGALADAPQQLGRNRLVVGHHADEALGLGRWQRLQLDVAQIARRLPAGLELGSCSQQRHQRRAQR